MSLVLAFLAACTGSSSTAPEPVADPAVAGDVAAALCTVFARVGTECTASGATAAAAGRVASATVRVVGDVALASQASVDLDVSLSVDGLPPIRGRVGGVGSSRADAIGKAVNEWGLVWGTAVVDAMRDTGASDAVAAIDEARGGPVPVVGGRKAYAGYTALKGRTKQGGAVDLPRLLEVIVPAAPATGAHAIAVEVTAQNLDRLVSCSVDGSDAAAVCDRARAFAWPAADPAYVVRQVVLLVPQAPSG